MKLKLYTGSSRAICSIMCGSHVTVKRQPETRILLLLACRGQNEVILKA